jgi:glycosyltransferase involved in cell wall biosynthesis
VRIVMIGARGIPASYGGIEHHVEELGARLAARGHDVVVATRTNYATERVATHRGMTPRYLPTVDSKHLDAIVHSAIATVDTLIRGADVVHYHAVGPGIPAVLPRYLSRQKVVLTVHGLDAERAKWGAVASAVLRTAQWMSARVPDTTIVVSEALRQVYAERYGRPAVYIPNGVTPQVARPPEEIVRRFGLRGGDYLLFVGRMVPEKAPDLLVRAFRRVDSDLRLVLVGGSSFTGTYVDQLRRLAAEDDRVLLTDYQYGDVLEELYANAAAYVQPSSLEGLPLTLLEAASYGVPLVVSDIAPHLEIVGTARPGARVFRTGDEADLADAIRASTLDHDGEHAAAAAVRDDVLARYRWEDAADATEQVYRSLVG